jgi:hypothetical protein
MSSYLGAVTFDEDPELGLEFYRYHAVQIDGEIFRRRHGVGAAHVRPMFQLIPELSWCPQFTFYSEEMVCEPCWLTLGIGIARDCKRRDHPRFNHDEVRYI